jgi:Family of unknown function (DUF5329)
MKSVFRHSLAFLSIFAVAASVAAPAPPHARMEIEYLLSTLQNSGCQFNRNGSWFTGEQAKAHLTKKLEYLEGKGLVKTSEDFINLGASESSSSGKSYLVRCPSDQLINSKTWLQDQLKTLRQAK